jgi:hypothetical protein
MAETIRYPHTQDGASPHAFHHEFQVKNRYIIHYCGKCKNVISIETQSNMVCIDQTNRFNLRGDV